MHPYYGSRNQPTAFKADDPRTVDREPARPSGDAARDGYTRHARRAPWGAPGEFATAEEIDRYEDMMSPVGDE